MSILSTETTTATIISLVPSKQQLVRNLVREVRKSGFAELDKDRVREDFHGLYSDILQELGEKHNDRITDFYELSEVLNEIAMLLTPETAYIYGWKTREAGTEPAQGFTAFMSDVVNAIEKSGLAKRCEKLFHSLCETLDDTRSLMTEYMELQSKVSIEQYQIHRFFELGYADIGIPSIYEQGAGEKQQWEKPKTTTVTKEQISKALESRDENGWGSCPVLG